MSSITGAMLTVLRVHLPSEIPIAGCEITPYVITRCADGSVTHDDVPEAAPLDGHFMRYRWLTILRKQPPPGIGSVHLIHLRPRPDGTHDWYRIQSDRKFAVCSVHPTEQATLQCIACIKAKIPVVKSYHCSSKCFADAWQHHRALHARASNAVNENGAEDEELLGQSPNMSNGPTPVYPTIVTDRNGGETWFEVGRSRIYTPTSDDIGHVLKFECVVIDAETKISVGSTSTVLTSRVIPAPSPSPRRMIKVNGGNMPANNESGRIISSGTFTVLSYNILSDQYATSESYSYCPSWALSWSYRRQNLLREIVGYQADILCLQEVQSDHFEEFFSPELDKHGYQGVFKRKTAEFYSGDPRTVDGCATFFRRDRFIQVKKYEVEFNKAAQSLTEAVVALGRKKAALNRLVKDNIALIVVLEAKFGNDNSSTDSFGKRQLVCVANTHINVPHDLRDVKIWQVHTLLKGLEKIAMSADIPMLVCGDFNSLPLSAPHSLLSIGKIDPQHEDLQVDPLLILHPISKLTHNLPLVSAYTSFARMKGVAGYDQQRKIEPQTCEPIFTNCTRDFLGTVDYIFYTADSLYVESLLELLDEESLRKDTALPSPEWSSDHIALLAEFRCMARIRR